MRRITCHVAPGKGWAWDESQVSLPPAQLTSHRSPLPSGGRAGMSESWEGLERVLTSFRVPGVDETLHSVGAGRWRAMGRAALCDRQGLDMEDGRRDYSGWLHSRRDAFARQLDVSSPPILCVGDGRFRVAALCCQDVHFSPASFVSSTSHRGREQTCLSVQGANRASFSFSIEH